MGTPFAEGRPAAGGRIFPDEIRGILLKNEEYLLSPADYGKLEKGESLLLEYPAGREGLWVSVSEFYFENNHGEVVEAVARPVSGKGGKKGEAQYFVEVSPAFLLDPEQTWYLKRKSKPAELFSRKVAVSHINEEYTFQSHEDAQVKLAHGVLANALVSGNSRPMLDNSWFAHQVQAPVPTSGNRGEDKNASTDEKDEEDQEKADEEEDGNHGLMVSGQDSSVNSMDMGGMNSSVAPLLQAVVEGAGAGQIVRPEEGYQGTVVMDGSGDIFLDSENVSDDGNKEKHYGLNIQMRGGGGFQGISGVHVLHGPHGVSGRSHFR